MCWWLQPSSRSPAAAASTTSTTIRIGRPDRRGGRSPRLPPSENADITTPSGWGGCRRSERPGGGGATWTGSVGGGASSFGAGGRPDGGRGVRRLQRPVEIRRPGRPGGDLRLGGVGRNPHRRRGDRLGVERFARQLHDCLRRDLPVDGGGRALPAPTAFRSASFRMSSGTTGVGSGALSSIARSGTNCAVFAACADSHSAAAPRREASSAEFRGSRRRRGGCPFPSG